MTEDVLMNKFPKTYKYLKKHYKELLNRDIDKKDKITAKQAKQIKYINRQLYSDFSAISKVQAEEIIDNYYNLAKLVKRGG